MRFNKICKILFKGFQQKHMKNKNIKVLFLEPNISKASPLKTLSNVLEKVGFTTNFLDPQKVSTKQLISTYLKTDLVFIQYYSEISEYTKMQFSLATILGVPVVRNWAGSDSLNSISRETVKETTRDLDKLLCANLTTTHQGIVDELLSIGLSCSLLPKIIDVKFDSETVSQDFVNNGILTYLPSSNREFYGSKYIELLINKYPQITFYILADDEHVFAHYPNVKSLGWIDDLQDAWNNIGLLVRMTAHDGYPRMFLEALARAKYIVHNNTLPGVWLANNENELIEKVMDYVEQSTKNDDGVEIYNQLVAAKPEEKLLQHLKKLRVPINKRKNALFFILKYKLSSRF
jgi:hypothetical protein